MPPSTCEPGHDSRATDAAPLHDDPFAFQAAQPVPLPSREFTFLTGADLGTAGRCLARRDPVASAENADERTGPHWVPLEWAYRTLRTRAFVTGGAIGAGVALCIMAAVTAAGTSASVVSMPAPTEAETAVAAVTPPPREAPRPAATRRTRSSPGAPDRMTISAATGRRSQAPDPVSSMPAASMTKAARQEVAVARSNEREAVEPVDSAPLPTEGDPGEPGAEDAETTAEASGGAPPESDDAADEEDGAQSEEAATPEGVARQPDPGSSDRGEPVAAGHRPDAEPTPAADSAEPESVAQEPDRESPGRIEPAGADDRPDDEAAPADGSTPESVSAPATIATAKPASD